MGYDGKAADIVRLGSRSDKATDRVRVEEALAQLGMAAELVDAAGRGLAPFILPASAEALLELSTELGRIKDILARRARSDRGT